MINRSVTTTARPISGAMNLNMGAPDAKQALLTAGFTFGAIIVMALGGLLVILSVPKSYGDTWSAYRIVGIGTGGMLSLTAFIYAFVMGNITVSAWQKHAQRLDDWHEAELMMYTRAEGQEITKEYNELELSADVAKDVLITAILIKYRMERQAKYRHAPWSVRGLEEKLYLDGNANTILIGELPGTRPEKMSATLAQLGLIVDRKPGSEGNWADMSYAEIIETIGKRWGKK